MNINANRSKSTSSSKSKSKEKHKFITGLNPSDEKSRFFQTSKLENYSKRKFIIDEKRVNQINSYIEPFNYSDFMKKNTKKKAPYKIPTINIGRISSRNNNGLINENNYPGPLSYNPKYEYVDPKVRTGKYYNFKK